MAEHLDNTNMPVIGLVGGIGSGKSTVAGIFRDLGCDVINADYVGHDLLKTEAVKAQLRDVFGDDIFTSDGEIDRLSLGNIVFGAKTALSRLNAIMHPLMRQAFIEQIALLRRKSTARAIILDAAVLFEASWNDLCDVCVFVSSNEENRLRRVQKERNWSKNEWQNRELSQISLDKKAQECCYSVQNISSITHLSRQVANLLNQITCE